MKKFEDVRKWAEMRGLKKSPFLSQYKKVLEETTEILEAYINEDEEELKDAIGDTMVTIINIAKSSGLKAEDCLDHAFKVIELRKGLLKNGMFVRYAKLSDVEKKICDDKQGNSGSEYFLPEAKDFLKSEDFTNQ